MIYIYTELRTIAFILNGLGNLVTLKAQHLYKWSL